MEKCIFVKFLGSQNCLPDEKMALKKALPDGNWALKYHYRTGIWLSNIITGRELGFPAPGKQFWEPKNLTKMHFSIFFSDLSDFSPMTCWSVGKGATFKPIRNFGWQSLAPPWVRSWCRGMKNNNIDVTHKIIIHLWYSFVENNNYS